MTGHTPDETGGRLLGEWRDRAEQLWLSAESLERQLDHQGADGDALSLVAEVVVAARELHARLSSEAS